MNALIIYETFDFAARAKATLERVTHQPDEATHWSINLWRVDVLKLPPAIEAALAEAMEAHLIMFAVSHVQSLLQSLFDWLERWARGRQIQEAALAVWDCGRADKRLTQVPSELLQFAQRHGLSLIYAATPLSTNRCAPTITIGGTGASTIETRHRCRLETGDSLTCKA